MILRSFVGGALALALHAQAATLTETDFLGDLPVVLTVSRMAQPLQDSPSSVTIIDQDMIRASGFQDIPDLLRLVPGFSVAYTRSNQFAVGYHGLADAYSRRFQVLVDGRSIYNPNFGEVNWGTLPLAIEDIERIEVVRGPNAAVYGANAFFAIINIISKDPSQTQGKLATVLAGEQNMAGAVLRYGNETGDLRYRLTLSSQHRDRFEKTFFDAECGPTDKLCSPYENFYERTYTRFFNGRWDYRLSDTDQVSTQVGLTGGNWNGGSDSAVDENRSYDPLSGFVQIRFNRAINADDEWNVQLSHTYETQGKETFVGPFMPKVGGEYVYVGDVTYANNLKQWRTQLDFSSAHRMSPDLRVVWGAQLRHEAVQALGFYGTNDTLGGTIASLFAHAEWRPAQDWLVQGGAEIAHHYFTGYEVSPRLAVSYRLNPQNTLRFAASQATRSPTFREEKGNSALYLPDTTPSEWVQRYVPSDLKPEVNNSVEIGYLGQWPEWGGQLDVRIYRDHVTDYIGDKSTTVWYTNGSTIFRQKYFTFYNGGTVDVTGLDVQLVWKPHRDFSLNLSQSVSHIKASQKAMALDNDIPVSDPRWITSVLASWRFAEGWDLSGMVYRTDKMYWLSDGDLTRGYTRVDARLARRFKLNRTQVEWAVGVQNIGNDYEEFRRQNLFTRRGYTTVRFAW
jgi:iron complex outermembrane receptor protein